MTNEYSSCIHEAYAIQRSENLNIIYICSKRSVIGIFKVLQKTVGRIWRVIWECYARCHSYKKMNCETDLTICQILYFYVSEKIMKN